jgi:hypothetical protein
VILAVEITGLPTYLLTQSKSWAFYCFSWCKAPINHLIQTDTSQGCLLQE